MRAFVGVAALRKKRREEPVGRSTMRPELVGKLLPSGDRSSKSARTLQFL